MSDRANNKSEEGEKKEDFKMKVVGPDGNEIYFGVLKKTDAGKLRVPKGPLRFLLEGKRINDENDDETPEQLKMKGKDVIELYAEQPFSSKSQIQGLLECAVCLEPSASPIYTCLDNGHLTCGFCHDKLSTTAAICPICRCKELRPNPLGERLSRQNDMEGNCPFAGCSERVLAAELKAHVKNCEYREIPCTNCDNKLFPLGEFPRHSINVHGANHIILLGLINHHDLIPGYRLRAPLRAGNEESEKYWGQPLSHFSQSFYEHGDHYFSIQAAVGNYMFYWWVTIFGGQKEADRYQYETELVWKNVDEQKDTNVATVQTLPILPYNRYEKYDKFYGNKYAMVHAATATAYAEQRADNTQKLTLRIKIFKTNKGTKRMADATVESASKRSK